MIRWIHGHLGGLRLFRIEDQHWLANDQAVVKHRRLLSQTVTLADASVRGIPLLCGSVGCRSCRFQSNRSASSVSGG